MRNIFAGHTPVLHPKAGEDRHVVHPPIAAALGLPDYAKVRDAVKKIQELIDARCVEPAAHEPDSASKNALIEKGRSTVISPAIRRALERRLGYARGSLANASRETILAAVSNLPPQPGSQGVTSNVPQPAITGGTSNIPQPAVGPKPGSLDLSHPSSQVGGRKNFPPGPDRDARDELVRQKVAAGMPPQEAEDLAFGVEGETLPLVGVFSTRVDEISADAAARHALNVLAGVEAESKRIPYADGLRAVMADPVHVRLVDALRPEANGYAVDDETIDPAAAAAELNALAREYQRAEKVPYVDALRAVSADHPELAEAREALYERRLSA